MALAVHLTPPSYPLWNRLLFRMYSHFWTINAILCCLSLSLCLCLALRRRLRMALMIQIARLVGLQATIAAQSSSLRIVLSAVWDLCP